MAQEVTLNLDVDGKFKVSSYAFKQREKSTIMFRLLQNNYLFDTAKFSKLSIDFVDDKNASNRYKVESFQSNVTDVTGEKLVSMLLPNNMLETVTTYVAYPKITVNNKIVQLPSFSIICYDKDTAEMLYVRQVTIYFNSVYAKYANMIKKDIVGKPNGVAKTDANNKVPDNNFPTRYKTHPDELLLNKEVHGGRINKRGQLEYLDPSDNTWKLAKNQPDTSLPHVPPVITVKDSLVTIKHDQTTILSNQKWEYGEVLVPSYFDTKGTKFSGNTFTVTKTGIHTYWYKTTDGKVYLMQFTVNPIDLAIIPPRIDIVNGNATVTHDKNTKVVLQKFGKDKHDVDWFDTNGEIVYDNKFKVETVGEYTLFYQVEDGRKFTITFLISESQLPPKHIPPSISLSKGVVTITHDASTRLSIQKYSFGSKGIPFFQTGGTTFVGKTFPVIEEGIYTYYYKIDSGMEYVLEIKVTMNDLPEHIPPKITTTDGIVTVTHNSKTVVTLQKFAMGAQSVSYFIIDGTVVLNNTFKVDSAGLYTLYYKIADGREFAQQFTVLESELKQPHIPPTVSKGDGKFTLAFTTGERFAIRKWDKGNKDLGYFRVDGNGTTTNNNVIAVDDIGDYTYYYKLADGTDYVVLVNMDYPDMPQTKPTIAISKGIAKVTHGKWMRLEIQKFDIGSRDVQYFENSGIEIINNTFEVTEVGIYTLYYKSTWGMEKVELFQVLDNHLAAPHVPPTITIVSGIATVKYSTGDVATLQKWTFGDKNIDWFQTSGTAFTGNKFTVTQTGVHTLYYKLDNGKEYKLNFTVQTSMLPAPFVHPVVSFSKGVATVTNHASTVLGSQKWEIGNKDVAYFGTGGKNLVNFKFPVETAGEYTVYTKLADGREFVTVVIATNNDLPTPRIDPVITIVEGLATVKYDPQIVPVLQKWDIDSHDVSYFATKGNTISGFTFNVTKLGVHSFYYKREDGREYAFDFTVEASQIPTPKPVITHVKGDVTITHNPSVTVALQKWAVGVQDIAYFQTNGAIVVDNKFTVTDAGLYTVYYKVADGREYVTTFVITEEELNPHTPPTFTFDDSDVTVLWDTAVEALVTAKKWDAGQKDVAWFTTNGIDVVNNKFNIGENKTFTFYYIYNGRPYIVEGVKPDISYMVPIEDIPVGGEYWYGTVWTKWDTVGNLSLDESYNQMVNSKRGATNAILSATDTEGVLYKVIEYYNNLLTDKQKAGLTTAAWGIGSNSNETSITHSGIIGMLTNSKFTNSINLSRFFGRNRRFSNNFWLSTYSSSSSSNGYATNMPSTTNSQVLAYTTLLDGRGCIQPKAGTKVEKVPELEISNGEVTIKGLEYLQYGLNTVDSVGKSNIDVSVQGRTLVSLGNTPLETSGTYVLADSMTKLKWEDDTITRGVTKFKVESRMNNRKTIANFVGKLNNDLVGSPNIAKLRTNVDFIAPNSISTEFTQNRYADISTLNNTSTPVTTSVAGQMSQALFSFNIIEEIERKIGYIPSSTLADKVKWVKDNISKLTFSWHGFGSSAEGYKATVTAWENTKWYGVWYTTSSSVKHIQASPSDSISKIGADGFVHFLAYAEPSDGTIASVVNTDYVELAIELNSSVELGARPVFMQVDNFVGKKSGSLVECAHIFKTLGSTSLFNPTTTGGVERGEDVNSGNISLPDNKVVPTYVTTNAQMAQHVFSFNLIEIVERKLGRIPYVTVADKVKWLKDNIARYNCSWNGFGQGVGGFKASLHLWSAQNKGWMFRMSTEAAKVTRLSTAGVTYHTYIESDGMLHILANAEASDGTIPSNINTDYVEIEVELKKGAVLHDPCVPLYKVDSETYSKVLNEWGEAEVINRYPRINSVQHLQNTAIFAESSNMTSLFVEAKLGQLGGLKDVIYKNNGNWLVNKVVEKDVVLDGSINWTLNMITTDGSFVQARFDVPSAQDSHSSRNPAYSVFTKYNGMSLSKYANGVDRRADMGIIVSKVAYITIPNRDTGFYPDYLPTGDELRAYFNGWQAKTVDANNKPTAWRSVIDGKDAPTQTIAYVKANLANNFTPYKLSYALDTMQTIDVTSSVNGSLVANGSTKVEIVNPLISKEKVSPKLDTDSYFIMTKSAVEYWGKSRTSHDVLRYLSVYKNGVLDNNWKISTTNSKIMLVSKDKFDTTAEYTVSYIAYDKKDLTTNAVDVIFAI